MSGLTVGERQPELPQQLLEVGLPRVLREPPAREAVPEDAAEDRRLAHGRVPEHTPLSVPLIFQRVKTSPPSTLCSSTFRRRSGKVWRNRATLRLRLSGPRPPW